MNSRDGIKVEKLISFAAGELSEKEAAEVASKIKNNSEAGRIVAAYINASEAFANDDSVAASETAVKRAKALFEKYQSTTKSVTSWLAAVDRFVASLIFDSRTQPAMAGYRGTAEAVRLSFECELGEIDIEIIPDNAGSTEKIKIIGQLSSDDAIDGVQVALTDSGTGAMVAETSTDETGMFVLSAEHGLYDLNLGISEKLVVVPNLEI